MLCPLSYPKSSPVPHGGCCTDWKMLSQWKETFSLLGCDISDNTLKAVSLLRRNRMVYSFLSPFIALSPREGEEKGKLSNAGPFHPGPSVLQCLLAPTPPPRPPRPYTDGLEVRATLGHQGAWKPLQTKQIHFKSPLQPEHFILVKSLLLHHSMQNQHNLSSGREGCRLQPVFFFG